MSHEDRPPNESSGLAIEQAGFVNVAGIDEWVAMRGVRADNPVLMIVGGSGVAYSPVAPFFAPWERDYTLLHWDQPGAGATHAKSGYERIGELSLQRLTNDGIAIAEYARRQLGVARVALLGVSGGSIVGLRMVRQRPELFAAFIGSGQFVDSKKQDQLSYERVLAEARATGNAAAIADLERIGPPPYGDSATDMVKSRYAGAFTPAEAAEFAQLVALAMSPPDAVHVSHGLRLANPMELGFTTYDRLRPDLVTFDARALGKTFAVPLFFFQGERDRYSVTSEVQRFADEIDAPVARVVSIAGGGHSAAFLRGAMLAALNEHVRPLL